LNYIYIYIIFILGFDINKSKLTENDYSYSSDEHSDEESSDEEIFKPVTAKPKLPVLEKIDSPAEKDTEEDNKKDEMLETYYDVMDHELYKTKLSKDFKREDSHKSRQKITKGKMATGDSDEDEDEEEDNNYKPVQLDLNLVQNLLDSFEAQEGTVGPTTSILKTLGQRLPKKNKDHEVVINPSSSSSSLTTK